MARPAKHTTHPPLQLPPEGREAKRNSFNNSVNPLQQILHIRRAQLELTTYLSNTYQCKVGLRSTLCSRYHCMGLTQAFSSSQPRPRTYSSGTDQPSSSKRRRLSTSSIETQSISPTSVFSSSSSVSSVQTALTSSSPSTSPPSQIRLPALSGVKRTYTIQMPKEQRKGGQSSDIFKPVPPPPLWQPSSRSSLSQPRKKIARASQPDAPFAPWPQQVVDATRRLSRTASPTVRAEEGTAPSHTIIARQGIKTFEVPPEFHPGQSGYDKRRQEFLLRQMGRMHGRAQGADLDLTFKWT